MNLGRTHVNRYVVGILLLWLGREVARVPLSHLWSCENVPQGGPCRETEVGETVTGAVATLGEYTCNVMNHTL